MIITKTIGIALSISVTTSLASIGQTMSPLGHPWYDSLSNSERMKAFGAIYDVESVGYCIPSTTEYQFREMYKLAKVDYEFVEYFRRLNVQMGEQIIQTVKMRGGCEKILQTMIDARR